MAEVPLRHEAQKPLQDGYYSHVIEYRIQSRANIGAAQNRLGFASANLASTIEKQEASRSTLKNLDIASEISNFTSKQVLMQAGVSMLAKTNQEPQNLMRLFG